MPKITQVEPTPGHPALRHPNMMEMEMIAEFRCSGLRC